MKTIQMTIDESLLIEVDTMIASLDMTRSAFMREAIKHALQRNRIKQLEQQESEAYARHPMNLSEILEWQTEQVWGDEWVFDPEDKKA